MIGSTEASAQRAEDTQQRLDTTGRRTDHDGLYAKANPLHLFMICGRSVLV